MLLKIFLFVQRFIPAELHMGNLDRAEILRWTLTAKTNKDNSDATMIRRNTYRYTSSIEVVMTFSVFFLIYRS